MGAEQGMMIDSFVSHLNERREGSSDSRAVLPGNEWAHYPQDDWHIRVG